MQSKNEKFFQEIEKKFLDLIYTKFQHKIRISRNKELVENELIEKHLIKYFYCFTLNPLRKKILDNFMYYYERGTSIDYAIENIIKERNNHLKYEITFIDDFFESANEKKLIRFFAKFTAYQLFIDFLRKDYKELYDKYEEKLVKRVKESQNEPISPIPFYRRDENTLGKMDIESKSSASKIVKWSGDKIDFIKLVYGMHNAKILDDGNGQITNMVENLAPIFGIKLNKGWQANFSNNKNYGNKGYNHKAIFEILADAYLTYIDKEK